MPLYDYRCSSCGDFRELRPMRESGTTRLCPVCGATSDRVISAPFLAGGDSDGEMVRGRGRAPGASHACGHRHGCSHWHGG
jgi:putative FmdB family regulatory protein